MTIGTTEDGLAQRLDEAIEREGRRVVVLDDDPTGTQTVSDVEVVLAPSDEAFDQFFESRDRALWVLTNSRSLARADAIELVKRTHGQIERAAGRAGVAWVPLLRGDSTLRGHVFAEIDAISQPESVTLFVPAFPEGGRTTRDGQQLVRAEGMERNVADTEFARDITFGYRSHRLVDWVAEVGTGRPATLIPLEVIRSAGVDAVRDALQSSPPGTVIIPEATQVDDLLPVALGLLAAEGAGHQVVVRSAATFAATRTGLRARPVDSVPLRRGARVLIACGSHTSGARAQLAALASIGIEPITVFPDTDPNQAAAQVVTALDATGLAALATPREFAAGTDVVAGAAFLAPLERTVELVADAVDAVIAKGGISSAAVARSLGATAARVEGQLEAGVPLWRLRIRERGLPYAVVPGNVGDRDTLVRILGQFGHRLSAEAD